MVFFSIYWGQEYFMNLQESLLLLLLGGPCLLQPLCGHQCSVTFLTFCSISSAIILLWPFKEQYFFPKLWENRLFQAAFCQKCISVGKHPAGCCCYEGWSLLLNYCDFFGTKRREHTATNDFRGGFLMKTCIFSRHSTKLFSPILNQGIFMPYQLLGFPQNNIIGLTQWPKTKMCFKLQKFSPCRGEGGKEGTPQGAPCSHPGICREGEEPECASDGQWCRAGPIPITI